LAEIGVEGVRNVDMVGKVKPEVTMIITTKLAPEERITDALLAIAAHGRNDGECHKMWALDQVARILAGDCYDEWVALVCHGEDGPGTYSWDTGVKP
jgi:hypothetical protein